MRDMADESSRPSNPADKAAPDHPEPGSLALGIERLGLVSLAFPVVVTLLAIALSIAAAFGVMRIRVDDSLNQLFRSDSAEFRQYEELEKRFPSSEFDVLVVVEGDK